MTEQDDRDRVRWRQMNRCGDLLKGEVGRRRRKRSQFKPKDTYTTNPLD